MLKGMVLRRKKQFSYIYIYNKHLSWFTILYFWYTLCFSGECKLRMLQYMKCMNTASSKTTDCRQQCMDYLDCRMDRWVTYHCGWIVSIFNSLWVM